MSARLLADESQTKQAMTDLAARVSPGMSVGLTGPLGAGKTTAVRYFAAALGMQDPVSSPTYVLSHEYRLGTLTLEHWDLYRLQQFPEELFEPPGAGTIRVIEWIDKFPEQLAAIDLMICLSIAGETARELRIVDNRAAKK